MHVFSLTRISISPWIQLRIHKLSELLQQDGVVINDYNNCLKECRSTHRIYNEIHQAAQNPHSIE